MPTIDPFGLDSVQSAPSKGKVRQGWADADRAGYTMFQNALVKYGTSYFSKFQSLLQREAYLTAPHR